MNKMIKGLMVIGGLYMAILVTDTEVLFDEVIVKNPDEGQAHLVCKYFNGRKVLTRKYWYTPNDVFGRSSCSVIK